MKLYTNAWYFLFCFCFFFIWSIFLQDGQELCTDWEQNRLAKNILNIYPLIFFFFFLTSLRSWIEKIRTLKWFSSYKKKKVKIFLLVLLAKPGFGIVCLLIVSLHWNRLLCLLENWGNFLKSGIVLFLLPVYKMMQEQSP